MATKDSAQVEALSKLLAALEDGVLKEDCVGLVRAVHNAFRPIFQADEALWGKLQELMIHATKLSVYTEYAPRVKKILEDLQAQAKEEAGTGSDSLRRQGRPSARRTHSGR